MSVGVILIALVFFLLVIASANKRWDREEAR